MILRSISTTKLPEILEYCRSLEDFQRSIGIPSADRLERFCIGFYQLAGTIGWQGTDCEWESYASAMIHTIVVMESLELAAEKWLPLDLRDPVRLLPDHRSLLLHASGAVQQLFYCRQAGKTERSKRYKPEILEAHLGFIILRCLSAIPSELREQAIHDATEILSRRI